jgi:phage host-nuclease inhibitor protein Gam
MTIPVDSMVKIYTRIRDKRAEIKAAFDEQDKELQAQLDKVKQGLLEYCKEHGVESVRTQHGLFYRTVKTRYWTGDWESMHKFIMEHGLPEFFEKRLNQSVVKEFLEQNPDLLPPGLNVDAEYNISVRKA